MNNIAVVGFGNVGKNLAHLFNRANYKVTVYSTTGDAGATVYDTQLIGHGFKEVDAVALALPYKAALALVEEQAESLADKIIIDCTNPLNDDWSPLLLGESTSAAEEIAKRAPSAHVVKAFNTIFADVMSPQYHNISGTPTTGFVAGDEAVAKEMVMRLVDKVGFAALDVGALKNARYLEAMAHLNIEIAVNQRGGTKAVFCYYQDK